MGLSNSQHNLIMSKYSQRQLFHMNELSDHQSMAYKICPRIRDIDDEIASISAAQAKKRIMGNTDGMLEFTQQLTALGAEKANLLETYQLPADYLKLKYDCDICKDTGVDGNRKCKCYIIAATKLLYDSSGLSAVLNIENFENFNMDYYPSNVFRTFKGVELSARDNILDVLKYCHNYVDNFASKKKNLLFSGPVGCGKTYMTHCIAKALMDKGFSVVYQSSNQFFDNLSNQRFGYGEDSSDSVDIVHFFSEADLLIIDDLGTELNNSFTNSRLFECINDRLMKGLGTIISTNESLTNIRETYSDRIYSRIIGNYELLSFFTNDIRRQKLQNK